MTQSTCISLLNSTCVWISPPQVILLLQFFFTYFFSSLPAGKYIFHISLEYYSLLSTKGRSESAFVGSEAYTVWEWSTLRKRVLRF